MKNQNFYMRVISLLLVILAVLFYNSSMKAQANEKEIAALTDKLILEETAEAPAWLIWIAIFVPYL